MSSQARKLHVVFASAEAAPFVKTGGLGDVAGSLPQALKAAGAEVVVMVPKYDTIAQEYKDRMEHLGSFYVSLGWRNEYCGLERLNHKGVDYIFLDNEHYFSRGYPYGFFDDGERFAFFSKAVTESLQHLTWALDGFTCDILHCNDWHTAMAPVFLREFYQGLPIYENVKTVFSIHNIAFQGQFSAKVLNDVLGMAHIPAAAFQLTCGPDAVNYMQGALNYTDAITTVSPTYAHEIQTAEYGEHLDGILRRRSSILTGIVNGIDTAGFDPATDPRIAANFTAADRSGKAVCKARLQEELGLEVRDDRPLMVMVTRLTRQKGMDLVTYALDRILSGGVQVAVLGTGDTEYENALRYFEGRYRGTCAARIQFDPALSQRMYAGADLFLMPSLFEPCGLSQMIAMRYGTLPVVRETGGLKDTVIPYNQFTGEGTGFTFTHFNGDEMGDAVFRGARLFWDNREAWNKLVDNAMAQDFSWTHSAEAYMRLYYGLRPDVPVYVPEPEPAPEPETAPEPEAAPASKAAQDAPVADVKAAGEAAPATPVQEKAPTVDETSGEKADQNEKTQVAADEAAADAKKAAEGAEAAPSAPATDVKAAPVKTTAAKKATATAAAKRTTTTRAKTVSKTTAKDAAEKPEAASDAKKAASASASAKTTRTTAKKTAATKAASVAGTASPASKTAAETAAQKASEAAKASPSAKSATATKRAATAAKKPAATKTASAAATKTAADGATPVAPAQKPAATKAVPVVPVAPASKSVPAAKHVPKHAAPKKASKISLRRKRS